MKIHRVQQGTPEWLQLRATAFTASEAPAMMGCSPYMTRTELLNLKHTGLPAEVDSSTQYLFDQGHAAEAQFRPIAEDIISDDLYPVTGSIELEGMTLLASFDGLNMDQTTGFEHKLWSEANVQAIEETGEPPIYHCWQMEHQLLVSGANEILFATSDGTADKSKVCSYTSKPARRAALIAGWKQFAQDLASHTPAAKEVKPAGRAPNTLPALHITVKGEVQLSNIAEFREIALGAIRSVNRNLTSDQDFADAEQSVKWCEEVESRLKEAKERALSQTASIDALFKTIDDISAEARKVRLELDRLVKARKDELRQQIVVKADQSLGKHEASLEQRVGHGVRIGVHADFAGVIKGKRSLASIQDAVDTELARAKIAANELADRAEANIKTLRGEEHDWSFLFPDLATVASKPAEDFANLLAARIAQHKQAEEHRRQREAEAAAKAAQVVEKAAAPQAQAAINDALITGTGFVRMSTESVERIAPETVRDTGTTIKLGDINARLSPIQVSAAGLAELGFQPVGKDKSAVLYRESEFAAICEAIACHVMNASKEFA